MSLINLFTAARAALVRWRQRAHAYDELMALDDRSLADIGIHRSQIPAIVEGLDRAVPLEAEPDPVMTSAFGSGRPGLAAGHPLLPPF